jgi:hypothetical protein
VAKASRKTTANIIYLPHAINHQLKVITLARKLQIADLERVKNEAEGNEEAVELDGLYDLIIPPGTPSYIIYDLVEEFELEPLQRKIKVSIVECDERELIVLRGTLEVVRAAEKFLHDELEAWVSDD